MSGRIEGARQLRYRGQYRFFRKLAALVERLWSVSWVWRRRSRRKALKGFCVLEASFWRKLVKIFWFESSEAKFGGGDGAEFALLECMDG